MKKAAPRTTETLTSTVTELFDPSHKIQALGIRHREKLFNTLLTVEEYANSVDLRALYQVPVANVVRTVTMHARPRPHGSG